MKIIKNYLPKDTFLTIKNFLTSSNFPWYYNEHVVSNYDKNFQFTHLFYEKHKINSNHFNLIIPLINKINPLSILRIKANLLTKTKKNVEHEFHVDMKENTNAKITTSIYYINTNNGYTIFKNNKKIKSKENTFVEFISSEQHSGASCTDKNVRIVLNINFIK